ncbi:ribonuclease HII [Arthrobacter sp. SW1]|uniref:ribonuclease HII n=1 Tax=Arthrobacter sp. SW1 TaxID=1920889 RepID=UPI000877D14E|nr:ribonuclease HII [Arthrobacter sp. SW1]OFI39623.1 ribonuclease HII [Arthrobacter sp. SW1]
MSAPAGAGAKAATRKAAKGTAKKPLKKPASSAPSAPTLDVERTFLGPGVRYLAGVDEVGRGAFAGPVSVGIAVVDLQEQSLLDGVRDSKLLKPEDRERLEPLVRGWAVASAVGHASAAEIDALGIIAALRLAGNRAWGDILAGGTRPDIVLLDGSHDWLTLPAQVSLFDDAGLLAAGEAPVTGEPELPACDAPVHTRVKADMSCLSVAAASVLAKVARDRMMLELHSEFPAFGWNENKGYGTAAHREALRAAGPSSHHRSSWNLI